MAMKPDPLFYIAREEGEEAGPYDLVQMAGFLRKKIITADTPTRLEDEEAWKPFSWHPQFIVAREMPADAVSTRVIARNEAASASNSPIPLPSHETLIRLAMAGVLILVAGGLSYGAARFDPTLGPILAYLGGGISLVAFCLIAVRLLDEDVLTLLMVVLIPGYDIFYFLSNIWEYFPYFCAKYGGAVIALAAVAGAAAGSTH